MVPLISKYSVKGEEQRKQEAAADQTVFCPAADREYVTKSLFRVMPAGTLFIKIRRGKEYTPDENG
jgi:hypothetical protein